MDTNQTSYYKKLLRSPKFQWSVKLILLIGVLWYIVSSLAVKQDFLSDLYASLAQLNHFSSWMLLFCAIGLLPVNWMLEALKWQESGGKLVAISFADALKGVLAGLSIGLTTPYSLGDYAGRIGILSRQGRHRLPGAVLMGRMTQFYATLTGGGIAFVVLLSRSTVVPDNMEWPIAAVIGTACLAVLSVLLFPRIWFGLFRRIPGFDYIDGYLNVLEKYTKREILRLLSISSIRYGVFTLQFVLLLQVMGVELPLLWQATGVALVFLTKSLLVSLNFFNDLGIREASSLYFFGLMQASEEKVLIASLLLWGINILVPSLAGMVFIRQVKLVTEK